MWQNPGCARALCPPGVWGRGQGLELRGWGFGFRVHGSEVRFPSLHRVQGLGVRGKVLESWRCHRACRILSEKGIKPQLSVNEGCFTACHLLVILKDLFYELQCQKGFNLISFAHKISVTSCGLGAGIRVGDEGLRDYSQVDILGSRYNPVNFGAETSPGSPNWR